MWEERLKIYDELVAANPKFDRLGKSMPYTAANTYMFSLLNKDGELGIRLSKESQEKFIEEYNSGPFYSHGATMRDYVIIPDHLLNDLETLGKYLDESYEYVMSLPPRKDKKK